MIGVGLVSVPAGLVASSLKKARDLEDEEKKFLNCKNEKNIIINCCYFFFM